MKINITKDDIETATRGNSGHCMIADAIKREHPDAQYVSVDLATIRFTSEKGEGAPRGTRARRTYLTPLKAQQALLDFDLGRKMKPFVFNLPSRAAIITPAGRKMAKKPAAKKTAAKSKAVAKSQQPKVATERATKAALKSGKPTLLGTGTKGKHLPVRVGGTPPPKGALGGKVRRYGLRNVV